MSDISKRETSKHKKHAKTLVTLSAAVLLSSSLSDKAHAQTVSCPQPLNFGDVMTCATGGTVKISTGDVRTTGGCVGTGGSPYSRARCIVTQGFPFRPIQVSVTAASYTINNGTKSMAVNGFNIVTDANGRTYTTTTAYVSVPIGATLNVGGSQAAGNYSGTFTFNAVLQ